MANMDALNGLKKSLDSFSSVALADFALVELDPENDPNKFDEEQQKFANSMTERVKDLLLANSRRRGRLWKRVEAAHGNDFKAPPVGTLRTGLCPPGFHDEEGICVPN